MNMNTRGRQSDVSYLDLISTSLIMTKCYIPIILANTCVNVGDFSNIGYIYLMFV